MQLRNLCVLAKKGNVKLNVCVFNLCAALGSTWSVAMDLP